jgi:MtN3 and saliva related transmembrane protein
MIEGLGWLSSIILVLTITTQVLRQWRSGTSEGVSRWLFIGQFAASTGFFVYSWLLHNWVFIATNGLMAVEALLGLAIVFVHRSREAKRSSRPTPSGSRPRAEGSSHAPRVPPRTRETSS